MTTRYQQLRQAVARLAASPEDQVTYLDKLFSDITNGGSAAAYGNDELAEEFGDIFVFASELIQRGELTAADVQAVQPLNRILDKWSGKTHSEFLAARCAFQRPKVGRSASLRCRSSEATAGR